MNILILLLIKALDIYLYIIIITVMMSWLVVFDVLNTRNKWVYKLGSLLNRVTNPPMVFLRRWIPPMGGIDFTPMVVIFGIYLLENFLYSLLR